MLLRKFDACFDPPNFWTFLSEYFIPGRFFWVNKTYFFISPGYLYIFLISKSNKNFCSQKWAFFWADFLRYEIILPKVFQIKIFRFVRKLNYVNLNLVQITASGHKAAKRYWERNFASHSHCFPVFFHRMLRTLSLYFLGLLRACIMGQKKLEYFIFFKSSKMLYC